MIHATRQPIAWGYKRFSSKAQEEGDSTRRQNDKIEKYCQANNWQLKSLAMDKGLSAFSGRNLTHGELGKFLKAIDGGKVQPGDCLIVESIDRLSRQEAMKSIGLLDQIISSGITVICIEERLEITPDTLANDDSILLMFVFGAIRSNKESKIKSMRVGAAWQNKHNNATNKPVTSKCPGWLELVDGKFQFIKEHKATIQRIVKMGINGMGALAITQTFNREKVKTFSRKGKTDWSTSTVQFLMQSKSLIGEYQPCKMVKGKQVPKMDAIKGYYPAVISEDTFYRLQAVIKTRKRNVKGKTGKGIPNIFGTILKSGVDGSTMHLASNNKNVKFLVASSAKKGSTKYQSFQYNTFENCFLSWISELELDKLNTADNSPLKALEGRLGDLQAKIAKIEQQIEKADADASMDRLLAILMKLEVEEKTIKTKIEEEKAKVSRPISSTADIAAFVEELKGLNEDQQVAVRSSIRAAIHSLIGEIKVYIFADNRNRWINAYVKFLDGSHKSLNIATKRGKLLTIDSNQISASDVKPMDDEAYENYINGISKYVLKRIANN